MKLIKSLRIQVVSLLLGLVASFPAAAGIIHLTATIDGAQANAGAGTGSTATGSATMTFDDVTNQFDWNINWSGLLGDVIVAHFHKAPPGANGGVEVGISDLTSPSIGSSVLSDAQGDDLLAGQWYINIHSTRNLGGEIRGQVSRVDVPEPSTLSLLGLGLLGLGFARHKSA